MNYDEREREREGGREGGRETPVNIVFTDHDTANIHATNGHLLLLYHIRTCLIGRHDQIKN